MQSTTIPVRCAELGVGVVAEQVRHPRVSSEPISYCFHRVRRKATSALPALGPVATPYLSALADTYLFPTSGNWSVRDPVGLRLCHELGLPHSSKVWRGSHMVVFSHRNAWNSP